LGFTFDKTVGRRVFCAVNTKQKGRNANRNVYVVFLKFVISNTKNYTGDIKALRSTIAHLKRWL